MKNENTTLEERERVANDALLGCFVSANLVAGINNEVRQGFVEQIEPLVIRGESGTRYECHGEPVIVSNPPAVFDPATSHEQLRAALASGLTVQRCAIDQHCNAVAWSDVEDIDEGWESGRHRIIISKTFCDCKSYSRPDWGGIIPETVLDAPEWSQKDNGICVDSCIADAIKMLWSHGIVTGGCCCGHNLRDPEVIIGEDEDADRVIRLLKANEYRPWRVLQWRLTLCLPNKEL